MLALSFLIGIWIGGLRAKRRGLQADVISDVGFWVILAAIIGARLYYVILHFEEFSDNLIGIFWPFQEGSVGIGGLVMYGGYIGAIAAGAVFFKVKKLPFLPYADAAAPAIGLGIFLTRIGCFLNGCCFGAATESGIGIHFPPSCPAGHYQLSIHADKIHPSQLYASAGGLAIAVIVFIAGRKKIFSGFEFYLVGLLYAVSRFIVDFTRFYTPQERIFGLSHNQIVCIILFAVFGGLILKNVMGEQEVAAQPLPESSPAPANPDRKPADAEESAGGSEEQSAT
jgi:phosphatidylglycerol:prolipoprotein diacylglycerol transferase